MQVPARLENLQQFLEFISCSAALAGFEDRKVRRIRLAAEEVFINVTNYAYPEEGGEIRVVCSVHDEYLEVTINDRGVPFNPLTVAAPEMKENLSEHDIGRLGIYLVRQLTDEMRYFRNANGNHLVLVFRLPPPISHA